MGQTIVDILRATWEGYAAALAVAVPRLTVLAIVLAAGWLLAAAAQWVVVRLLRALRFGAVSERTGAAELLRKAELPTADRLAGSLVFWLLFGAFLLAGLDALGLETLATLRDELLAIVPRAVTALMVLLGGLILANLAWRVALLAAVNARWRSARLVSGLVYALVTTFAATMALYHLRVARDVVLAAFVLSFGAIVLAAAVAVGIGAGPLVRRVLEEQVEPRRGEHDSSSHL